MTAPLDKILYVEDDPDIQAIAVMVLDAISGFNLEPCLSGAEALSKAVAFNPDLILLDVMMPVMDGPETLHALHKIAGAGEYAGGIYDCKSAAARGGGLFKVRCCGRYC
ncbi:MAG: response regulator [Marinagarivorans sp.]|nr:response regulator [Marinagarivorans sp.]